MMNQTNGMMSPASSSSNNNSSSSQQQQQQQQQSTGLKTYFKTPEGRYKYQYEKTHPTGLLHYAHGKTVTQVTVAHLKDKPVPSSPTAPSTSSFSTSSGVKSVAARMWASGNGSRALSFIGGNGGSKTISGNGRIGSIGGSISSNVVGTSSFDEKGSYLIFNVGDAIKVLNCATHHATRCAILRIEKNRHKDYASSQYNVGPPWSAIAFAMITQRNAFKF